MIYWHMCLHSAQVLSQSPTALLRTLPRRQSVAPLWERFHLGRTHLAAPLEVHCTDANRITTAPSFGPLLGGVLAYRAGWRWIFWLLSILSGVVLAMLIFTLPETARSVTGNGSNEPPKFSRPLIPGIMRPWQRELPDPSTIIYKKKSIPNPVKTLVILCHWDTAATIAAGSILYMIFCASHASLSTTLKDIYSLNELEAGLIYLPYGASCLVSTLISGKLINRDYRKVAQKHGLPIDKVGGDDLTNFPIEEARLRSIFLPTILTLTSMIGYGWAVHYHAVSTNVLLICSSAFSRS
jgi:MFS family permease